MSRFPSDAVVYDYKGKTIYPSLIELVSDYGQPELKRPQEISKTRSC